MALEGMVGIIAAAVVGQFIGTVKWGFGVNTRQAVIEERMRAHDELVRAQTASIVERLVRIERKLDDANNR